MHVFPFLFFFIFLFFFSTLVQPDGIDVVFSTENEYSTD